MDGKSLDLVADKLAKLREIFPEAFSEEQLDIDKLQQVIGQKAMNGNERYSLSWAGKGDAFRVLQEPTTATLVPAREESINFDETGHIFIEGENLEVLKVLQKAYYGKVKMVYIDPPYNTGSDSFIYPDRFAESKEEYLKRIADKDETGLLLKEGLFRKNSKENGQYHSNWLSMMYPRLYLARNLLREDGVIFVSIDDNEVHNLKLLLNEIFGEENFIASIIWQKVFSPKNSAKHFSEDHDYILVYARQAEKWRPILLPRTEEANARYDNPDNDKRGDWSSGDLTARNYYGEGQYEVTSPSGRIFTPPTGRYWVTDKDSFLSWDADNRIWWGHDGNSMPRFKRFLTEVKQGIVPQTLWKHTEVGHTQEAKKELLGSVSFENTDNVLDTVKPTRLLRRMLQIATDATGDDLVLDFFAGSCPTAQAVLAQNLEDNANRKFICVQLPEKLPIPETKLKTISDIGKERITHTVAKITSEQRDSLFNQDKPPDLGFKVFKLRESNFKSWRGDLAETEAELAEQLDMFVDTLRPEAQEENVAYELMLKSGFELTTSLKRQTQGEANYWSINDGEVLLLLSSLDEELIDAVIAARPQKVICLDSLFHGDDQLKTNTALTMKDAGIPFEVV